MKADLIQRQLSYPLMENILLLHNFHTNYLLCFFFFFFFLIKVRLDIYIIKTGRNHHSVTFSEKQEDMTLGKMEKNINNNN